MMDEREKLSALTRLGVELSNLKDVDHLMRRLLTEARRFVNSDAGSIYIREDDALNFSYTQNETLEKRLPPGAKLVLHRFSVPINLHSLAGYAACTGRTVNVPDVYSIDGDAPYHFNSSFDEESNYRTVSVLTIPLQTPRREIIGVLQMINAKNDRGDVVAFSDEDERMMDHFASLATVAIDRTQMTRGMILRMIRMAELHDPLETGMHVTRVGALAAELYTTWATERNVPAVEIDKKVDILRMAAMLHDVGKVGISDVILKKRGRFDEAERAAMQKHTIYGARLFVDARSDFDAAAGDVALNHHERWDGEGYPGHVDITTEKPLPGYRRPDGTARGKKQFEIPLFGRIVAVCDVYDALRTERVYKKAWTEDAAIEAIGEGVGTQFDPELAKTFVAARSAMGSIYEQYME